jgi:hypothetical protein
MPDIAKLTAWAGFILVLGFCGIVFYKIATGVISLDCLLYGDARPDQQGRTRTYFSPGRLQMMMVTIISAGYLLLQVIQDPTKFPEIPNSFLVGLGGSQAIYLGGKAQAMYLGPLRGLADALLNRRQP